MYRSGSCALVVSIALYSVACAPRDGDAPSAADSPAAAVAPAATPASASAPAALPAGVDYMSVANRLVTQNLRVKAGEAVLVTGTPADMELLEDLAIAVRRQGAWPVITVGSERLDRLGFDSVPAERDADRPNAALPFERAFQAMVVVEPAGNQANLRHVPPERFAARARASEQITAQIQKLNRRVVFLGNSMTPSADNARLSGLSMPDLTRLFWEGVNADPSAIAATGAAVRAALAKGKTVRVTAPGGTDLTLELAGHDPYVSDGIISDEDVRRGPSAQTVWLPAGEVYVRVAPNSANGTVVVDHHSFQGESVEGLRVDLKGGRVTSMTATRGLERLKANFDAATPGKDAVTILDIGVNEAMKVPSGSRFSSYVPAGTVTVVVGNDTWAGGPNNSSFGLSLFLKGATLTVDGTPLVKDGAIQK